ncbi:hypothetical protein BV210_15030 [Halorientalis sp. IM1011]|uniref:DUF7692 domain-containing protein n=1 Tax=Halorientalis sp. IM1011 TaxID=1932360 RepID=UPI00097CD59C|nr:hypothetical protein [Halorientalis sp. IM1011]AQL43934.1 hypothetical protein BV210_15030 [Halorientalis sp. IM1011]
MRIREDGKHAHRTETIEQAAEFWECNKTIALVKSADFACRMDERIIKILNREDLTPEQKRSIAQTLTIPSIYEIEYQENVTVDK